LEFGVYRSASLPQHAFEKSFGHQPLTDTADAGFTGALDFRLTRTTSFGADGKTVFFTLNRGFRWEIWRMQISASLPVE
jgi:hypothetical protein